APPFHDATLARVYARLLHETAPPASSLAPCPPAVDAVLSRALAKSPHERPSDVRSFLAALDAADGALALAATGRAWAGKRLAQGAARPSPLAQRSGPRSSRCAANSACNTMSS